MKKGIGRGRKAFSGLVFTGLMVMGSYAYTASNTVDASNAGQGATTISGYTITSVQYTLDTSGATANVSGATFSIAPTGGSGSAPTTVKARLTSSGTYVTCSNTTGTTWSCPFTGVTALSAASLDVAAAQ